MRTDCHLNQRTRRPKSRHQTSSRQSFHPSQSRFQQGLMRIHPPRQRRPPVLATMATEGARDAQPRGLLHE